jgi:hypothetical protein
MVQLQRTGQSYTKDAGHSFFTLVNDTHDCFRTPTNQTIHISYESLGLATTKMHLMRDVLSAMEDDGAWDCHVYRPNLAFRLLVFLYGKGYYDDLPFKSAFIVFNSASRVTDPIFRLRKFPRKSKTRTHAEKVRLLEI